MSNNFILKSRKIHNNKYDYSKVIYINNATKVIIVCPEHGEFWQLPLNHLAGYGCIKCGGKNKLTTKDFIEKANKIHGNKYDYSKTIYVNTHTKVCIICPVHGEFWQTPSNHTSVNNINGCPRCYMSKGEKVIEKWLKEHNVKFVPQYKFNNCRGIKNALPFDFYLPKLNTCIEYDGELHFSTLRIKDKERAKRKLKQTRKNDKIKNLFCKKSKIRLIRIKFDEVILDKLNKEFL